MEIIATVFHYISYGIGGLFGLLALLIILALVFGKRVIKKWEYEADFRNDKGREIGEFDIEMKKFAKEETDFTLHAKFQLRHPALTQGKLIQVFLNEELVMQGNVENEGRIYLTNEHLKSRLENPVEGQICKVMCSAEELFSEPIQKDH